MDDPKTCRLLSALEIIPEIKIPPSRITPISTVEEFKRNEFKAQDTSSERNSMLSHNRRRDIKAQ